MSKFWFTAALVFTIGLSVSFGQETEGTSKLHLIHKQPIPPPKAPPLYREFKQQLFSENSSSSPPPQLNSIVFDSSRNGYGLSSSVQKSVDATTDAYGDNWVGGIYRTFSPDLCIVEYDMDTTFDNSNLIINYLTVPYPGYQISGSFPSFQAAPESPIPIWSGKKDIYDPNTDALLTTTAGWGPVFGFSPPISWTQNSDTNFISNIWSGSTDLFITPNDSYYVGGVWRIGSGNFTFLYGKSTDLMNWTFNTGIINWPYSLYEMNSPSFAYGSNGFGAWVSTGYFVGNPDDDFKLMLCTTNDYGATWGPVQRFEWSDLGIPTQITADDSIYVPDSLGIDSILYVGPAHVGITYTFDLIIPPTNELHVGCTITWGPLAMPGYYPNQKCMGLYDLHSSDMGQTWTLSRIWWNSGLLPSDSSGQFILTNEIDLGYDDVGNIYAAWVDRDPHNSVLSPFPRTDDRFDEPITDIFASVSWDGGNNWSYPLQITDDQQHSAYGLRLSSRTKWFPQENGKTYVMYQIADFNRIAINPPTTCADHVNWLYLAEVKNFPLVNSEGEDRKASVLPNDFVLYQNYPNPFNPETTIEFHLSHSVEVRIEIFNVLGQKIRTLFNGRKLAGLNEVKWDGRDESGKKASSGVYIYRLKAGEQIISRKMLLMR